MAKLPDTNPIHAALEHRTIIQRPRSYLGMSQLGHECDRYLVYSFRRMYVNRLTPQKLRVFERGDLEEPRIIRDLLDIDIQVFGTQEELTGFLGHCKGHIDGLALNVPGAKKTEHLLEFKTMNNKYFTDTKKKGYEKANPGYCVQLNVYMHYKHLTRALVIVTNKDTEERYYERIKYNKEIAETAIERSRRILLADSLPDRIGGRDYFRCKWCAAYSICHLGDEPERNCRTCYYGEMKAEGKWHCAKHDKQLKTDQPCEEYRDNAAFISDDSQK